MSNFEFGPDDRKVWKKSFKTDLERYKEYDEQELYNMLLGIIKEINDCQERINSLHETYTIIHNIVSFRLSNQPLNEFGCLDCIHVIDDEELGCGHVPSGVGGDGIETVCGDPHDCPYHESL